MAYSRIVGTGSYLPAQSLSNVQLESRIDTTDEWIFSRTGIRSRNVAAPDEKTSDLGLHASRTALDTAGVDASEVDLIVVDTQTQDMKIPTDAAVLQHKLGLPVCEEMSSQTARAGRKERERKEG